MAISLFTRKKQDQYSVAPNMSTNNGAINYQSTYKQPTTSYNPISAVKSYVAPYSPATSVAKAQQASTYFKNPTPPAPNMSVAPKQIQGSGYSSNFASNPSNYKTPTPTAPPPPKPLPQQASPIDAQTKALNDFLESMRQQNASREQQTMETAQKQQNLLGQRYDLMGQAIQGQIDPLKSNFDRFRTNSEANIADVTAQGELQKDQARDYYGEANRTAAQARQETGAQAGRKFAGQGAIDSAGAGSYREANENIDSEFNRVVAQNAKALAGKQTEIDMAVGQYTREAKSLIQQEEANLMQQLKAIDIQFADNAVAKEQAMLEVFNSAQERVYQIQDRMSEIEQQAMQQKQNIALELAKLDTTKLSAEFMATGIPTNQTEYEYMIKNADTFEKLGLTSASADQNKGQVVSAIQRLSDGDIAGIVGMGKYNPMNQIPGSKAQQTYNDWKNLQAMLSLESRQQLKGSGAISDFEAKVLERAANLGLDTNLSEEQFRSRLGVLMNEINGGQLQPAPQGAGNIITAPDGQQVMIVG